MTDSTKIRLTKSWNDTLADYVYNLERYDNRDEYRGWDKRFSGDLGWAKEWPPTTRLTYPRRRAKTKPEGGMSK